MSRQGHLKLGAFFHPTGHHVAAWLHPQAQIDAGTNFRHYVELAQLAERGKFDFMFLADSLAFWDGPVAAVRRWPQYACYFDPLTLLPALAAVTSHLGLVATASTSYNEPFHVARRFASLELISGGRSGWNVVTSANAAEPYNFNQTQLLPHAERYTRGREFYDVVTGLWDSWEPDAFVRDRATSIYFDQDKLHSLNHTGKYYAVRGPLHVGPSPQGRPVIVVAAASSEGVEVAGEIAEVVFAHQLELTRAQQAHKALKEKAAFFGRSPEAINLMPGINPIIGSSLQEAQDKFDALRSKIHPDVGRAVLSVALGGFDVSDFALDEELPSAVDSFVTEGSPSTLKLVVRMAREQKLTVRQLYEQFAGARGQRTVLGTSSMIADEMQEWFEAYGVDGFLVQPAYLPGGLHEFVEHVMPELVRRGLFRAEYDANTLRGNLGLKIPTNRYVARRAKN
jgi:FMN-dependent oxidoreductase (nitrilotriacetate monooxygenase family)